MLLSPYERAELARYRRAERINVLCAYTVALLLSIASVLWLIIFLLHIS